MIHRTIEPAALSPVATGRLARYEERRARSGDERDALRRQWNRLGNLRVAAFFATLGLIAVGLQTGSALAYLASALAAGAFILLIARHRRIGRALSEASALHDVNAESLLRCARHWELLPLKFPPGAEPNHAFAADLDLFGHASLFHLLETVETPMGADRLRDWLLHPGQPTGVEQRQRAVAALASELEWRQALQVDGRLIGGERVDPEPLLTWCEAEPWLARRPVVRILAAIGPIAFALGVVAAAWGWAPSLLLVVVAAGNILLTQVVAAEARSRIALVARQYESISQYARLLGRIEAMPGAALYLDDLRARLTTNGHVASELLRILGRRAAFAIPPGSMLYLPLQAVFAWDVNALAGLEAWQRIAGGHVRDWLTVIGETEATAALATLAYDHPEWAFPAVDPDAPSVLAAGLGHPLLPETERVTNEVEVGPVGAFLLVTGSNMSGKSTLLRAIGVNVVLAGAGGPVCATAMTLPPIRLWTSVRVEDSLERGVSFFMAELQRLKAVVDAADAGDRDGRTLLFLLDEILQGTNTAERQVAARRVIRHLVDAGAMGAVSTHDLTLADGPELAPITRAVHLRDTVTADGMEFDYKLRPGIATSTNALRLMEIVFGPGLAGAGERPSE